MLDELVRQLPSLGIGGLLFVMWWCERQERVQNGTGMRDALRCNTQVAVVNDHLLDVVRANTAALSALREELRAHRIAEMEWFGRLSRQLEKCESE
ncbi:MAG: hypothetical protein KKB50_04265 [Planctomycetes bacterium]|nr:hypothetical protein [Planctomycetota bacterium]